MDYNPISELRHEIHCSIEEYWRSFHGDASKQLEYAGKSKFTWLDSLAKCINEMCNATSNYLSGHPRFQELLMQNERSRGANRSFFPRGVKYISDIVKQLNILLPSNSLIESVLPFLLTCYIAKYRTNMKESTQDFIDQLIEWRNPAQIDIQIKRKLGCFDLSPLTTEMPKITYNGVVLSNPAILRRYHISLMFCHILLHFGSKCNISLTVRLFNEIGGDLRIFLSPAEYDKVGLNTYDYDELLKDSYRDGILEVFLKRMPPFDPQIELDYITLRFKRVMFDHDDSKIAEDLFEKSLTDLERMFLNFGQ